MTRFACAFVAFWRTLRTGVFVDGNTVSGCDFVQEEKDFPAMVTLLHCERCGKYDVGWRKL